jgi:hypothetical protein
MITECELHKIKGLIHYLNENLAGDGPYTDDIDLICDDGESHATIGYDAGVPGYVLKSVR